MFIYTLTDGDQPFYVGKTNNLKTRKRHHIYRANSGNTLPVYNKLRKMLLLRKEVGMVVLEDVTNENCDAREQYYISRLRSEGVTLLNLADGGEGGKGHTAETIRTAVETRLRNGSTPRSAATRSKISAARKGNPLTAEHRAALRKGWKRTPEQLKTSSQKAALTSKGKINTKRYVCVDPDGTEHLTDCGLTLFCEQYGLQAPCLHKVLSGDRPHHKGWTIRRIGDEA